MEKMFIINDPNNSLFEISEFSCFIDYPIAEENLVEDFHFHEWIIKIFGKFNPTSLIIPLTLKRDSFIGLTLGLHIRLNEELTHEQRCIPLFFVSNDYSYETIFSDKDLSIARSRAFPHYLLMTPNVYLETPNIEVIKKILSITKPITSHAYKTDFLDRIKILPSEKTGKHSLANIWGAFRLAETTGHSTLLDVNKELLNKQKDLYFKYIRANSYINLNNEVSTSHQETIEANDKNDDEVKETIAAKDKNILLIDDEANQGWGIVLKEIFKGANFETVDSAKNSSFDVFYKAATAKSLEMKEVENKLLDTKEYIPKWDLILLDLRLDKNEDLKEQANKLASEYSGAKLLKVIKEQNKGTQVIIFTASNKAWNMRELMDIGADGFFIKESPEYYQDNTFSLKNYESFKKQVEACFDREKLRLIYYLTEKIKNKVKDTYTIPSRMLNDSTKGLIKIGLEKSLNAISNYSQLRKEYSLYSFLEYYKIIEILGKELISKDSDMYFIKDKANAKIDFIKTNTPIVSAIEPQKGKDKIVTYSKKTFTPEESEKGYYLDPSSALRFSGLMLLRFGFDETKVRAFMDLNHLRNSIAAHSNSRNSSIQVENVVSLVEILKEAFERI